MVDPSKLCSVCFDMLHPGLEAVENSLLADCQHHSTFSSFKQAVEDGCFICAKLWDSVTDVSIIGWSNEPRSWIPFECGLERRPWAPRWYGAIYWHIRYLAIYMGPKISLKYKGNVFCFLPCEGTFACLPIKRTLITKIVR
jgi:hypothetical protein